MNNFVGSSGAPADFRSAGPPNIGLLKRILRGLRMLFLPGRYKLASVGRGFYMGNGCIIKPDAVKVGHYCFIGNNCHLSSKITIGNWVMLASQVSVVGGDHDFTTPGTPAIWAGRGDNKEVLIEDDAWVGHGALIMHGVRIGEGAVVAAGSLVTKDVEPYSIVGGCPAHQLRMRFSDDDEKYHRESLAKLRKKYNV